jgi:23S rRNA (cytidine1920-2'-O)/16S rRNA (cytidine1409-2'-O)-methyltransferase
MKLVLPAVEQLVDDDTRILAMVKPQFESESSGLHKGVIKNSKIRRDILKDFENWAKQRFLIVDSRNSGLAGSKGNVERFYLLKIK